MATGTESQNGEPNSNAKGRLRSEAFRRLERGGWIANLGSTVISSLTFLGLQQVKSSKAIIILAGIGFTLLTWLITYFFWKSADDMEKQEALAAIQQVGSGEHARSGDSTPKHEDDVPRSSEGIKAKGKRMSEEKTVDDPKSTPAPSTGSITQKNSGGVNVQQGTTGNNSPIINSPIVTGNNSRVELNAERELSDSQYEQIRSSISKLPPYELQITAYASSEDAVDLGSHIGGAIKHGGWKIKHDSISRAMATDMDGHRGLAVLIRAPDPVPAAATQLSSVLTSAGIPAPIVKSSATPPGVVVLWIGRK